jgi:hypothetical protein
MTQFALEAVNPVLNGMDNLLVLLNQESSIGLKFCEQPVNFLLLSNQNTSPLRLPRAEEPIFENFSLSFFHFFQFLRNKPGISVPLHENQLLFRRSQILKS